MLNFFGISPHRRCLCISLMASLCMLGCVRVEAERDPHQATRLIVTRDTKGVNMQFQSDADLHYTVYYRDPAIPNDEWKQLPTATEIKGTGDLILINDPAPTAFRRKYRIQSLVLVKRKDIIKTK